LLVLMEGDRYLTASDNDVNDSDRLPITLSSSCRACPGHLA
jgi:hypothetical protein